MKDLSFDRISDLGYQYEVLEENVVIIKNFFSQSECERLTQYARSRSKEDWEFAYMQGVKDFAKREYGADTPEEVGIPITHDWYDKVINIDGRDFKDEGTENFLNRVISFFDEESELKYASFSIIQRQYEGSALRLHYDQFVDKTVEYAAVAYPNDDYTGGEFYFKEKGLSFRVPKGALLIFPGTEEYWHGVHEVGPGPDRYAMPIFIHNKTWKG